MIQGLDAIDNGIDASDDARYREGTHLSERVARMNLRWNQEKNDELEDAKVSLPPYHKPCHPPTNLGYPGLPP